MWAMPTENDKNMSYIIEESVMFDEVKGSLSNIETKDEISLPPTAACILLILFSNDSSPVERSQFIEQVYTKFGFDLSNNTLNQYISLLRKNIRNLGIESDVIITIPRVGFYISTDVKVVKNSISYPDSAALRNHSKKIENKQLVMTAIIMALVVIVEVIYLSVSGYTEPEQYPLKKKEKLESVIYIYPLILVGFNRRIRKISPLTWRTDTCLAGQVRFSSTI
jgi:DNA-binding winged helix-turn-helix (wHTH) protein